MGFPSSRIFGAILVHKDNSNLDRQPEYLPLGLREGTRTDVESYSRERFQNSTQRFRFHARLRVCLTSFLQLDKLEVKSGSLTRLKEFGHHDLHPEIVTVRFLALNSIPPRSALLLRKQSAAINSQRQINPTSTSLGSSTKAPCRNPTRKASTSGRSWTFS